MQSIPAFSDKRFLLRLATRAQRGWQPGIKIPTLAGRRYLLITAFNILKKIKITLEFFSKR